MDLVKVIDPKVNIKGDVSLKDFTHPEECIYWFGDSHNIVKPEEIPNNIAHKVYIPMNGEVHSYVAGAMVLWDRIIKNG